ncbi:conserved unknown protein [Ectocarpus siliculosus]|uniref:Uncharacterized protein n=1 Tax=Ectocarpus siliculosus TaxID=2880 RepID=D7FN18_ECTSI|nr:conserved unknown protein [Ectocarpus siliculosus]|eukprot:CBJ30082.1 conserved unknown protein [Ectocarpus siliculosus]
MYLFIARSGIEGLQAPVGVTSHANPTSGGRYVHQEARAMPGSWPTLRPPAKKGCSAAARFGKPGLLEFAKANRCGWTPATCAQATGSGHLGILKRLRARGCGWDEETRRQAAIGGHLKVLKWARAPSANWLG